MQTQRKRYALFRRPTEILNRVSRLRHVENVQNRQCPHSSSVISTVQLGYCDFVVVVALLFYVHGKHLRSCRDGQLTSPLFSWAGLDLLSG